MEKHIFLENERIVKKKTYLQCCAPLQADGGDNIICDNVDYLYKINKKTFKLSGFLETQNKRVYNFLEPKNSHLCFATAADLTLLAYDKRKDFRLFFEAQLKRESWCLETINGENMLAVG